MALTDWRSVCVLHRNSYSILKDVGMKDQAKPTYLEMSLTGM